MKQQEWEDAIEWLKTELDDYELYNWTNDAKQAKVILSVIEDMKFAVMLDV